MGRFRAVMVTIHWCCRHRWRWRWLKLELQRIEQRLRGWTKLRSMFMGRRWWWEVFRMRGPKLVAIIIIVLRLIIFGWWLVVVFVRVIILIGGYRGWWRNSCRRWNYRSWRYWNMVARSFKAILSGRVVHRSSSAWRINVAVRATTISFAIGLFFEFDTVLLFISSPELAVDRQISCFA